MSRVVIGRTALEDVLVTDDGVRCSLAADSSASAALAESAQCR